MNFISQLNRILEPIKNRIRMSICRAIVSLVDDSTAMQIVQLTLMKDETKSKVERVQNYGFTSNPLSDSECIALFINGNRDHGIAIAIDDSRYRLKNLPEGGVAIYDNDGNYCKLTKDNGIEINTPNKDVKIKAFSKIELGNTSLKKLINEEFASIFNSHVHNFTAAPSGSFSTSTPLNMITGIPGSAAGSIPATFINNLGDNQMTSKVKAE